jgi:hypothetical protein
MNNIIEMKMKSILCADALQSPDKLFLILKEFLKMAYDTHLYEFPDFNKYIIKSSIKRGGDRFNIMASRREDDKKLVVTTMILICDEDSIIENDRFDQYVELWIEQVIRLYISDGHPSLHTMDYIQRLTGMNKGDAFRYMRKIEENIPMTNKRGK